MIDRCGTCGYSRRQHDIVISHWDGTKTIIYGEPVYRAMDDDAPLVCPWWDPIYHVEGVL